MSNLFSANTLPNKIPSTIKMAFVLLAFLIPFGGVLFIFTQVISGNMKLDSVDFAFCMTTLTNCQDISPFFDITGWREVLIRNGIIFTIWLIYAAAVYGFFNAANIVSRGCCFAFVVLIPLSFASLGLLITLLEGAHM